jgi:hypothetical protein
MIRLLNSIQSLIFLPGPFLAGRFHRRFDFRRFSSRFTRKDRLSVRHR